MRNRNIKKDEFDSKLLDVARVTRVMAGGRRFSFRTLVVVGDKKTKLGIGIAKGYDIASAINKATNQAKKNLIIVPKITHQVEIKFKAARLMIRPRKEGLVIGGILRQMCRLGGIHGITGKIRGSNNKVNNAKAFMKALCKFTT